MDAEAHGLRILQLRTRRGLGRRELADFAQRSERWVWDLEHGRARLDRQTAERLAFALRVDIAVVLGLAPLPTAGPPAARFHGEQAPSDKPQAASELTAVRDLLDWLAAATGRPTMELERLVTAGLANPPASSRMAAGVTRERVASRLISYYGEATLAAEGLRPYSVEVDGHHLRLSVVTRRDWIGCTIRLANPITSSVGPGERSSLATPAPLETDWEAAFQPAIDRLVAVQLGAKHGNGPVLVNKPLYRLLELQFSIDEFQAIFAVDWFAHYALSYDLLEAELLAALGAASPMAPLPLRDRLLGEVAAVAAFGERLCVGGPVCLFAVARPASQSHQADFLLVVQQRSRRVLNVHGGLAVIPKGFHQHLVNARDEVCLGTTVFRELEEELFGRQDFDEANGRGVMPLDPYHPDGLSAPMRWIAGNEAATIECLGFGINLVSGNYEFANLICIDDEEFWARHRGSCLPNWEAADVQTYSSADPASLRALIMDDRWTNEGLFALLEGLRRLARRFPERVALPSLEVVV